MRPAAPAAYAPQSAINAGWRCEGGIRQREIMRFDQAQMGLPMLLDVVPVGCPTAVAVLAAPWLLITLAIGKLLTAGLLQPVFEKAVAIAGQRAGFHKLQRW